MSRYKTELTPQKKFVKRKVLKRPSSLKLKIVNNSLKEVTIKKRRSFSSQKNSKKVENKGFLNVKRKVIPKNFRRKSAPSFQMNVGRNVLQKKPTKKRWFDSFFEI